MVISLYYMILMLGLKYLFIIKMATKNLLNYVAKKIIRNSARCLRCKDHIESKTTHDFVRCQCGLIAVDGGKDYQRRMGPLEAIEETSIVEEVGLPLHK